MKYAKAVAKWSLEKESLGICSQYCAKKARQKAMLFSPYFRKIEDIKPKHIKIALMELSTNGGRSGKGLSSATLRQAHLYGKQTCDWAVENGIIEDNPFSKVKRPIARYRRSLFLTKDQSELLAKLANNGLDAAIESGDVLEASFHMAVCMAIATGMRRGELFALDYGDIDGSSIHVVRSIKAGGEIGEPKTDSGIRDVAIGDKLISIIERVRDLQCKTIEQPVHILCTKDGERVSLNAFEHWWRKWADSNGFRGLRFHELRHTHATLLIAGGVDVKTVQTRMGHSTADITLNVYAHAIPNADRAPAQAIDANLFGGSNGA